MGMFSDIAADIAAEEKKAAGGDLFALQPAANDTAPPPASLLGGDLDDTPGRQAAADVAREETESTLQALQLARGNNPDTYAKATRIAQEHGVPVDHALGGLPDLEDRKRILEMRKVLESDAALKRWFEQGDNPKIVDVDDLNAVKGLSWLAQSAVGGFEQGQVERQTSSVGWREMIGRASPEEIAAADVAEADPDAGRSFGADTFMQRGWVGSAKMAPLIVGVAGEAAEYATKGAAVGAAVGGLAGNVPGAIVGGLSGAKVGGMIGAAKEMFETEAGAAFREYKRVVDPATGQPVDPKVATGAALIVGTINTALEGVAARSLGGFGKDAAKLLGMEGLVTKGGRYLMTEALKSPTMIKALAKVGANMVEVAAVQAGTEMAQEFSTIVGAQGVRTAAGAERIAPGEVVDRVMQAGIQALEVTAVLGAPGVVIKAHAELGKARQAQRVAATFEAMGENSKAYRLRERLPEKSKELVAAVTAGGGVDAIYISNQAATEYFQSKGIAPDDFMPGLGALVDEAQATGSDVRIPLPDYVTHVAGSDFHNAMVQDMRADPKAMTAREGKAMLDAQDETMEWARKQDQEALATAAREAAPGDLIEADVRRQLIEQGMGPEAAGMNAILHREFFTNFAKRAGVDPTDLYERHGAVIKRALPEALQYAKTDQLDLAIDALRKSGGQVVQREMRLALGESMTDWLKKQGGLQEFGGELSSLGVTGGLLAKPGAGLELDRAAMAAWEAGFLPDLSDRPTIPEFLEALDDELRGRPRYRGGATEDTVTLPPHIAAMLNLENMFRDLGINPAAMTNAEIREELAKVTNPDPDQDALYQLVGLNAATVDDVALGRASLMEAAGASIDEIWVETGFFRGVDGFWRFEIADTDAKIPDFDGELLDRPIGALLRHPKLYEAYPQLRRLRVNLSKGKEGGVYRHDEGIIDASGPDVETIRLVLLHEVQHAIQQIEGHAYGAAPTAGLEIYEGPRVEQARDEIEFIDTQIARADRLIGLAEQNNRPDLAEQGVANRDELIAKRSKWSDWMITVARQEYYERYAGEVEARNVMKRAGMTAEELRETDPAWTQDRPSDVQTVIFARVPFRGAAFEAVAPEPPLGEEYFQGKADKRGSIQFGGAKPILNLFEHEDASTFLHESGHLFLEIMKDTARQDSAPPALKEDWQTVRGWLGVGEDNKLTREQHEKWAEAFEGYLGIGKAPSEALQPVFARFKSWLISVYKTVRGIPGQDIPAEIRQVMDRMLASDQEIGRQSQALEFKAWFRDAEEAGMSPEQFMAYQRLAADATDEARAELTAKLIADVKRETTREWRENKAAIRKEVLEEFSRMPVYQVTHYLRTGEVIGEVVASPPPAVKLSRDWLLENYTSEIFKRLPRSVPPIYTKKGGVDPDLIAEAFGYGSGQELVNDLISAPSMARAVNEEVRLRMQERFGDLLAEQDRLSQEAIGALHNEKRGQLLEAELAALNRRAGNTERVSPRQAAAQIAKQVIAERKVGDATRSHIYEAAEARSAKAAQDALVAGDLDAALLHKRQQLFSHYMALESRRAKEAIDKATKLMNRFTGRAPPPGVDPEYVDQIQALLERFDMRPASARELARRKSFAQFIAEAEERGDVLTIPEDHPLRDASVRKHYKDMNVEDVLALRDAVQNLEHLGRLKKKLKVGRAQRDFETVKGELVDQASKLRQRPREKYRNPEGIQWRETILGLAGNLVKMEQMIEWLDQGDINGGWRRLLWQPIADAQVRREALERKFSARYEKILEGFKPGYLAERIHVAELGKDASFTREELMAFALNTGNASNLDKMLRGEAMVDTHLKEADRRTTLHTQDRLQTALGYLSKEDWDTVQNVWTMVNDLWPEIAAVEKRVTGVEPPRVEAQPVQTRHGTYQGGYYPLAYDPRISADVARRKEQEGKNLMFPNTYIQTGTSHGFTKERKQGYARPVATQLHVIGEHIAKVIHDVSHREAVRDANKLLRDPEIQQAITSALGQPLHEESLRWLNRIAVDRETPSDARMWQWAATKARTHLGIFAMGYRASTVLAQFAGLSNSLEFVKPRLLAASLGEFMRDAHGNAFHKAHLPGTGYVFDGELTSFVLSKSGEMQGRLETTDRDIHEGMRRLAGKSGTLAGIQRSAFFMIGVADRVVTIPTWHAAYTQHLAANPGDEAGAIAYGDRAVRLSQGAGGAKDISSIMQRGSFMSFLTPFYSFFNAYFNRQWAWARDARIAISERNSDAVPGLVGRALVLSVFPAVIGDLLTGKGPDSEEDEGWGSWAAAKILAYQFASIPALRDVAGGMERGFGDFAGTTPIGRFMEALGKTTVELARGPGEADMNERKLVKNAADLAGMVAGVPVGQLNTTGNNIWRSMEEGNFTIRDLFFPKPPKK